MTEIIEDILEDESEAVIGISNPFPGLRPFTIEESHLFFGREGQSDEVLVKLSENKFVGVIGSSGSGKSSFIYCGVIPILYGGFLANKGSNWDVIVTRPGGGPIDNMAEALLIKDDQYNKGDQEEKQIRKRITSTLLRSSSLGLIEAILQKKESENTNYLVLVDQFEELFRFKKSEEGSGSINETLAFVNLLVEAVRDKNAPIYVAITMRSDFIGECAHFPELTRLINDSHYLIPQMSREQKRNAIMGPVAVGGGHISPRLVQQLLNDLGDNPDQLPILQHALMRTWSYWVENKESGEIMDLQHYDAIGRMAEALSQHANEAYDELTEPQKAICESMFKALTEKGSDSAGIRRPTKLNEIAAIAGATEEEVIAVIEKFRQPGRSLLTPAAGISIRSGSIVDISHESLMRIWVRLKNWVEDEGDAVQMYQRLAEAAAMYQTGKAGLWRPPDLQIALTWQIKHKPTLVWAQRYNPAFERTMVFLEYSKKEFETEQKIKEMLQKRALKRSRNWAMFLGGVAVVCIGVGIFALTQKIAADKALLEADVQRTKAEANANQAKVEAEKAKKAESAALQEKKKAEEASIYAKQQATLAQQQKLQADEAKERAVENEQAALEQKKQADFQRLRAEDKEKEANEQKTKAEEASLKAYKLRLLSIAQSMAVKSLQENDPELKGLAAQQAFLFNKKYEGRTHHPDIYDGLYYAIKQLDDQMYKNVDGHAGAVRALVATTNGNTVFSAGSDGKVLKWDATNTQKGFETIAENKLGEIALITRSLALSNDNRWLAIGGEYDYIQVIDVKNISEPPLLIKGVRGYYLTFTPDNSGLIFTSGANGKVFFWDFKNYTQIAAVDSKINSIAINKKGNLVVVGNDNGQVVLIDREAQNATSVFYEHKGINIHAVTFSNSGKYLVAGDLKGIVRIWEVNNKKLVTLTGHTSHVDEIVFSNDDKMMATSGYDKTIRLWDMEHLNDSPIVLKDHQDWVHSVVFSADGERLFAGLHDHSIKVWPTKTEVLSDKICKKVKRNMNAQEWEQYIGKDIDYEQTCPQLPVGEGVEKK